MGEFFGTDGIRGRANHYPLTADMAVRIGRSIGIVFGDANGGPPIIIGRDTRRSGQMLESAVAAGICSAGTNVLLARVLPTPGVAFLTHHQGAAAGVVISASHNPFEDNGIKVFNHEGLKLSDREEAQIERLLLEEMASSAREEDAPSHVGGIHIMKGSRQHYLAFLLRTIPNDFTLEGMKIVLDCANGATSALAPNLFDRLNADLTVLHHEPSGTNINQQCGSEHPESLCRKVLEMGADVGLAFDGDGDRLIAVDETGKILTGDQLLAVAARFLHKRGQLQNDVIVSTVMSNLGLKEALRTIGIRHVSCDVGDRRVMEKMTDCEAALGGEDSGHIIYRAYHSTGDGLLSALKLVETMQEDERPLSEMVQFMTVYPQTLVNVPVGEKPELESLESIGRAIRKVEEKLGERGRVLVRYSGTQSICRVMVEGPKRDLTEDCAHNIAVAIADAIGDQS
jgi:phosphoglucosamine mutase